MMLPRSRTRRQLAFLFAALLALMLGFVSPAQASGELELSKDGSLWGQSLSAPLFDPTQKLVPGGSLDAEFWVRNSGPTAARLLVKIGSGSLGELFQRDLVTLSLSSSSGTFWKARRTDPNSATAVAQLPVTGTEKLRLVISLDVAAANDTQSRAIPVEVQLILAGTASTEQPVPPGPDLPNTGVVMFPLFLAAACLMGGWGAVLLARRRRDREDEDAVQGRLR